MSPETYLLKEKIEAQEDAEKLYADIERAWTQVAKMVPEKDCLSCLKEYKKAVDKMSWRQRKSQKDLIHGLYCVLSCGINPYKALEYLEKAVRSSVVHQTTIEEEITNGSFYAWRDWH